MVSAASFSGQEAWSNAPWWRCSPAAMHSLVGVPGLAKTSWSKLVFVAPYQFTD